MPNCRYNEFLQKLKADWETVVPAGNYYLK